MKKRAIPLPGKRVRGSKTGRAIMAAMDLFGRRWSLRVVWELRNGPLAFRSLQAACAGITPSVLNTRLAELREGGIVSLGENGYELTELGQQLDKAAETLSAWAEAWAATKR